VTAQYTAPAVRAITQALAALADWIDEQLSDRQLTAEHAAARIRQLASAMAANPPRPRIDGSIAATVVRPDGSAVLSPADLATVLDALGDGSQCGEEHSPDSPSLALAARYRALSRGLEGAL
jgi:hypothetical protein